MQKLNWFFGSFVWLKLKFGLRKSEKNKWALLRNCNPTVNQHHHTHFLYSDVIFVFLTSICTQVLHSRYCIPIHMIHIRVYGLWTVVVIGCVCVCFLLLVAPIAQWNAAFQFYGYSIAMRLHACTFIIIRGIGQKSFAMIKIARAANYFCTLSLKHP